MRDSDLAVDEGDRQGVRQTKLCLVFVRRLGIGGDGQALRRAFDVDLVDVPNCQVVAGRVAYASNCAILKPATADRTSPPLGLDILGCTRT